MLFDNKQIKWIDIQSNPIQSTLLLQQYVLPKNLQVHLQLSTLVQNEWTETLDNVIIIMHHSQCRFPFFIHSSSVDFELVILKSFDDIFFCPHLQYRVLLMSFEVGENYFNSLGYFGHDRITNAFFSLRQQLFSAEH